MFLHTLKYGLDFLSALKIYARLIFGQEDLRILNFTLNSAVIVRILFQEKLYNNLRAINIFASGGET